VAHHRQRGGAIGSHGVLTRQKIGCSRWKAGSGGARVRPSGAAPRNIYSAGAKDGSMSGYTTTYDVRCEHCLVIIRLGVVSPNPDRDHDDARLIEALNELLVDYGWLPTRSGRYCRNHATGVRGSRRRAAPRE
jgi:hypothetical protein